MRISDWSSDVCSSDLSAKHKDLLGDLTLDIDRAEIPGKGTYYRVQAGMLPSADAAKKICTELAKRKTGCIIVRPRPEERRVGKESVSKCISRWSQYHNNTHTTQIKLYKKRQCK